MTVLPRIQFQTLKDDDQPLFTEQLSLQLGIKPGVSAVMTHSGATLSEMIRIQLLLLHSSDIAKDVVVAATVRVCAHTTLYTSVAVCYFWEPCLLLTFKPTGNGKWFAILKLKLRSDSFQSVFFSGSGSHCDRLSSIWRKRSLQQQITDAEIILHVRAAFYT